MSVEQNPSTVRWSERALALERAGDWAGARLHWARAFQQASRERDVARMADALRAESRLCRHLERHDEAEELVALSREIAERRELGQAAARAINLQAVHRFLDRDWSGARVLYEEALERARDHADDELIGHACQNLGVLANVQGDLREARIRYLESVGAAIRSGNQINQGMAYNNLGMVCSDLGEWTEALLYFDRALEIADRLGDAELRAKLLSNRAEPLIRLGDLAGARNSLDQAEIIARRLNAGVTLADIARFRGTIARGEGNFQTAERQLSRGLRIAAKAELKLERAELLEELARLRWAQGRAAEALSSLRRAIALFRALGASRDTERAEALQAGWEAAERPDQSGRSATHVA